MYRKNRVIELVVYHYMFASLPFECQHNTAQCQRDTETSILLASLPFVPRHESPPKHHTNPPATHKYRALYRAKDIIPPRILPYMDYISRFASIEVVSPADLSHIHTGIHT